MNTIKHQTRNIILAIAGVIALQFAAKAQTNTFPNSGNVGIGTTNPTAALQIEGLHAAVSISGSGQLTLQYVNRESSPDQRISEIYDRNGQITFRTVGDSYLTAYDWMDVFRSENSFNVDRIALAPWGGRVGIGTCNPSSLLTLVSPEPTIDLVPQGGEFGRVSVINFCGTFGFAANGDVGTRRFAQIRVGSSAPLAWDGAYFGIWGITPDGGQPSELLHINTWSGDVGIGTATPTHKLTVNGAIRAKEVIVDDTGWADYVFSDDYKLQSLDAIEQHIKETKHLPGIPSAQEINKQGVSLGDMQTLLLSKIEELTLHQIDLNKRLNAQDEKLDQQSRELEALRQENAALKSQSR